MDLLAFFLFACVGIWLDLFWFPLNGTCLVPMLEVGLVWVILWLPLMLVGICGCLIAFFACVGLISFLDLLWCLLMGFVLVSWLFVLAICCGCGVWFIYCDYGFVMLYWLLVFGGFDLV